MVGDRMAVNSAGAFRFEIPHLDKEAYATASEDKSTTNTKILMYNGTKPSPDWYLGDMSLASSYSGYPHCSHTNDPNNPTIDICFGAPKIYYSSTLANYTNNNLYNLYWSKFIEEIIDPDSKIITGNFLLNSTDISALDFSVQYLVDNHILRLNSIKNYDPTKERSMCKVEFIKVKEAAAFSASTVSSFGGVKKEL